MTYVFSFDASACTGCKACQEACKDKNNLPLGLLWRRVIEVSGGEWQPKGSAWESSVFAYNLSLACNHCTYPKCAGVCPTDAYTVRPDGILLLDTAKCMGCGYCAWACPYGAPQYDRARGVMTKCDFCYDYLDDGLPPSCVAACPLRVLEIGELNAPETLQGGLNLWQLPGNDHPYPLPGFSRTEPHLSIKLHPGMSILLAKAISNQEEVLPPASMEHNQGLAARRELPLVAFTLLTQMAAGMAAVSLVTPALPFRALLSIGILLIMGAIISFLHLGRKRNAWRAVIHVRKSWLSREICMAGLFGLAWAVSAGMQLLDHTSITPWPMSILGLGLVYCMSRVYRLRAVPEWETWRTPAAFFLSTVSLGMLGMRLFLPLAGWIYIVCLSVAMELGLVLTSWPSRGGTWGTLRLAFLGIGFLGALVTAIRPELSGVGLTALVLFIVLVEEVIGRWQFYALRVPFPMRQ